MATLGNIASTANALQQYQAGNIDLQAKQQANIDRQNLIKLFQSGDPDTKALPDGTFSPALYGKILQTAPQMGPEMIAKFAANNTAVTGANKAQFSLGQDQNQQIAQAVQDVRGKPRSNVVDALKSLQDQ